MVETKFWPRGPGGGRPEGGDTMTKQLVSLLVVLLCWALPAQADPIRLDQIRLSDLSIVQLNPTDVTENISGTRFVSNSLDFTLFADLSDPATEDLRLLVETTL